MCQNHCIIWRCAFLSGDYNFYDTAICVVPHSEVFPRFTKGAVGSFEITWRFKKSAQNFTTRRFLVTGNLIYCPVDAAVSIVRRTQLLRVSHHHLMGVWSSGSLFLQLSKG